MSEIEKHQKQLAEFNESVARAITRAVEGPDEWAMGDDVLRPALQKVIDAKVATIAAHYKHQQEVMTLQVRVTELEASVATFHEAWKGAEADCSAQVRRVAELEAFQFEWQQKDGNTPGYNLQKAKNYGAQAYEWKQKAIKLEAREAQHLARISELEHLLGRWCAAEVMCDVPERRKLLDETGSMLLAKKGGEG